MLHNFELLCNDLLALAIRESRALAGLEYQAADFYTERKSLLSRLEENLVELKNLRAGQKKLNKLEWNSSEEIKSLFSTIQRVVMKVLLLDKQNQEMLLQRGLVPANCLNSVVKPKNNFVVNLYRRHSV